MRNFSLRELRRVVNNSTGKDFHHGLAIDEYRNCSSLVSASQLFLATAIKCCIIDDDRSFEDLSNKAHQWLQLAVESRECRPDDDPNLSAAIRLETYALSYWMLRGEQDYASLTEAVENYRLYFEAERPDKSTLSLKLPAFVDAQCYDEAQRWIKIVGRYAPSRTMMQREGLACQHICALPAGDRAQLESDKVIQAFLEELVPRWMRTGDWMRLARWMHIVYVHAENGSAKATILNCFRHAEPAVRRERDTWNLWEQKSWWAFWKH
jgi:hypothetical protein